MSERESEVGITVDNIDFVALVRAADHADGMIFLFRTVDGRDFHFGASVRDTLGIVAHFSDVVMKNIDKAEARAAIASADEVPPKPTVN